MSRMDRLLEPATGPLRRVVVHDVVDNGPDDRWDLLECEHLARVTVTRGQRPVRRRCSRCDTVDPAPDAQPGLFDG